MQTVRHLAALREALSRLARRRASAIALVPTMGALHAGHLALVEAAKRAGGPRSSRRSSSIPTQFGPNEDLGAYPRQETADSRMLAEAGVRPAVAAAGRGRCIPTGFATNVSVSGVSDGLDGAARPGHFDGVATVVAQAVQPGPARRRAVRREGLAAARGDPPHGRRSRFRHRDRRRADPARGRRPRAVVAQRLSRRPRSAPRAVALPRALGVAARAIAKGDDAADALAQARDSADRGGLRRSTMSSSPMPRRLARSGRRPPPPPARRGADRRHAADRQRRRDQNETVNAR